MSGINGDFGGEGASDPESELRSTRIAPAATLMVGTSVITQLMVLSGVAIVMDVAAATMCAFVVELLVLTAVATALERGVFTFEDIGNLSEVVATLLFTVTTVLLASLGIGRSVGGGSLLQSTSVAALRLK